MDLRKLQRIVVDALDDIKAQDIRVFNTTGQTELFDRVIIATGTSNRQTRSLAAHVRDKVKEAGGTIVSMEGGDTGEWVLVDLGDAVVHIMQPAIRAYYNLEELWGAKPVRMKLAGSVRTGLVKASEPADVAADMDEPDELGALDDVAAMAAPAQPRRAAASAQPGAKRAAAPAPSRRPSPPRQPPKQGTVRTVVAAAAARKTVRKTTGKTARKTAATGRARNTPAATRRRP